MWVSASNGDLVNLDRMESVQAVGTSVNAQINGDRWITLVQAESREQAGEFINRIAVAIVKGEKHLDFRAR